MESFSFNGVIKPYIVALRGSERPAWADMERELLEIQGLPGAHLTNTKIKPRTIAVPVLIKSKDLAELQKIKEDMAEWLITDEPCPLIFDDEPDRTYYAVVDGGLDVEEIVRWGRGVIRFVCPDPHKYGSEKLASFVDAASFQVSGTAKTYPKIKVEIKKDTTFVAVGDGDKINLIGSTAEVTQQPFLREQRVFWHEMGTLVGWADTNSIEEGENTGVMRTDSYSFFATDYGEGQAWHGPAKKISIGTPVQDFWVDALVRQIGYEGQVGSVEIALLDTNNRIVGKMHMSRKSLNNPAVWATFRAGNEQNGHDIMRSRGDSDWAWAEFNGILRISRIGNVWEAWVARSGPDGYHTSLWRRWEDTRGISAAPIGQIQVSVWQYGNAAPSSIQRIDDVKVFRINKPGSNQIPYVARAGDVIEFDHVNDIIRKSGEDVRRDKAFIGEYFSFDPGRNTIVAEPADAVSKVEVRWRDKWL